MLLLQCYPDDGRDCPDCLGPRSRSPPAKPI